MHIRSRTLASSSASLLGGVLPCVALVVLFWVVRYWHSSEFGLYEDDFSHMPRAAAMTAGEMMSFVLDPARYFNLEGQGRPMNYASIYFFTNAGWRVAGLHGPYLAGFAIEALNTCLLYALLSRIHSRRLGFLVGLAYVLYSADTTQAYLTLSLGFQPSVTLFLLAAHAYASNRRFVAYGIAALMLMTYETVFVVFLAFPLLLPRIGDRRYKEMASHALILLVLLALASLRRSAVGDDRLAGLGLQTAVLTPLLHMVQGPPVSLGTYVYRPLQALMAPGLEVVVVALLVASSLLVAGMRIDLGAPAAVRDSLARIRIDWRHPGRLRTVIRELPSELARACQIAFAGLLMLILAYPLTFTVRAYAISGRDTRVHAAGAIGAAIVVGTLVLILLWIAEATRKRALVVAPLAVWLGLLAGYGMVLQSDYVRSWEYQKAFWSELVPLLPDVTDGTVVLIEPSGLEDTRQIAANHWSLPLILEQLYDFPATWGSPPRVYRMKEEWAEVALDDPAMIVVDEHATHAPADTYTRVDPENAILVETSETGLARVTQAMSPAGEVIELRPLPSKWGQPPYVPGLLWEYMISTSAWTVPGD